MKNCLSRSVPEIHSHDAGTLSNQPTTFFFFFFLFFFFFFFLLFFFFFLFFFCVPQFYL